MVYPIPKTRLYTETDPISFGIYGRIAEHRGINILAGSVVFLPANSTLMALLNYSERNVVV